MYSRKSIAALLTGTSLSALSVASVPAFAATYSGLVPSLTISSPDDFIYLDDTFEAAGDVTVEADVGPGNNFFINGFLDPVIGMMVEAGASIGGTLFIENGATISATTSNVDAQRSATALRIEGEVPRVQNDGVILASAFVDGTEATATAVGVYHQFTGVGGVGSEALSQITNTGDITADAFASMSTWSDTAYAEANAQGISQQMSGAETAWASLDNSGNIVAEADATAIGDDDANEARAYAYASGVTQSATATGGAGSAATAQLTNSGEINVSASALASGQGTSSAYAQALAVGVSQNASGAETALASLTNSGDIDVSARATAIVGDDVNDYATARLYAYGVLQNATATGGAGSTATARLTNSGNIDVSAFVFASQQGTYTAIARMTSAAQGVSQSASGAETARATLDNSGNIMVSATAIAIGGDDATEVTASAFADGVTQYAYGNNSVDSSATVQLTNSGSISATAFASASSQGTSSASASASAQGVYQYAASAQNSLSSLNNSGDITAQATAYAFAGDDGRGVSATAYALGVTQHANANSAVGSTATAQLANSGDINVSAFASGASQGTNTVFATATAQGVYQSASQAQTALATLTNDGDIVVSATAYAFGGDDATSATASAFASGVTQYAYGNGSAGSSATVRLANNGSLTVTAFASASSQGTSSVSASAAAQGVYQYASQAQTALATLTNDGDIVVNATAYAIGGDDVRSASATAGVYGVSQYAQATGGANSSATVALTNSGSLAVAAFASESNDGTYSAFATATAQGVYQYASQAQTALAALTNDGDIVVSATAYAFGGDDATSATAYAFADGISQEAHANSAANSSATIGLANNGSLTVTAFASASSQGTSDVSASATADGIYQRADQAQTALATIVNSGDINVDATAYAIAIDGDVTGGSATAYANGISQFAVAIGGAGSTATAGLVNSGNLVVAAFASALSEGDGSANASATARGVYQEASGALTALTGFDNSGDLLVDVTAYAFEGVDGTHGAEGRATATGARQFAGATGAEGSSATAMMTNSGVVNVDAFASGSVAGSSYVFVSANALGVQQQAMEGEIALASLSNTGDIVVNAEAYAFQGDNATNSGSASAGATGVWQFAEGIGGASTVTARLTNTGNITVTAFASASSIGETSVNATAIGYGAYQHVISGQTLLAEMINSSSISVNVSALARASDAASVNADAYGVYQQFSALTGGGTATARLTNVGSIDVFALASASTQDSAHATASGYVISTGGNPLTLDFENSGLIQATASAAGSTLAVANAVGMRLTSGLLAGTFENSGAIVAEAVANSAVTTLDANATGVLVTAAGNDATFENSGLIRAYAEADGTPGAARGVAFEGAGAGTQATFSNLGGTVWAGFSDDGGDTVLRGTAIQTQNAPNPVLIALQGNNADSNAFSFDSGNAADGAIFGDIDISADDAIEVTNGTTWLNGLINPDSANEGTLDIFDDGNLVLMNREDGPSNVFVSDLTVQSNGTLSMELTPDTYPSINTTTASLGGTFVALYRPGLYTGTEFYDNVIASGNLPGQFDTVTDNSLLLETEAVYEGNNVDLNVTRVAFDAIDGLTRNQRALSEAIENVYGSIVPGSDFENLIGGLFAFSEDQYLNQLNSLTGSEYAQSLQQLLWSTSEMDRTLAERMGLASGFGGGGADAVLAEAPAFGSGEVWGRASGGWHENDGDEEASAYDGTLWSLMAGGDFALSNTTFVGLAGALIRTEMDFDWSNNQIDYTGGQLAVYGGYDDQSQYVRGIATAAFYSGESTRHVVVAPGDPVSTLEGDPDATVFSISGEVGKRFELGGNMVGTPFLGARYAHASLHSFTEDDPDGSGAALDVDDSSGDSFVTIVGARVAGEWSIGSGVIRPEASIAWMHEFGDSFQTIDLAFAGAPVGGDFSVISSDTSRDSALLSVGARYDLSASSQLTVKYDGTFNSDYNSHAFIGRYGRKF